MTTAELLTHLRKLNVTLSGDNGQLILRGPKGALTADLRAELKERKAEILKLLKSAAIGATPMGSSLPRVSREKDLPLSFAQQRLWFLDQLEPGSTVYNVPGALRIEGPLSVEVLERCFNEIVRRHEALRTTFSIVEEEPVQVIAASANVSLSVIDISYFCETEREEEALRLAAEEANKPFDLRQGPLFRTALIRLGENEHILLLTLHHIVSDGWSMGVLYRELSALYQAFANEEPAPLADLPIQYADFAAWQREWLQGEVLETQLSYWKKQLDGAPAVLNLPTDRPRPAEQSYRGARQSIELSSELTQGLKALSRKEGVTLYMALLAAFQILLHRHTGQDDIVVGSPIANRNRIEIEGLIGFFVNTLVLRTDHSGNPTFCELLHRVRETALEAYAHQDLPFEKLVEELRPDRDLGRSSLFQAMFVFQNAPAGELNCKGLNVSPMRIAGETTKFDLTLSVHEGGPGLRAGLQYSTDLFEETTITRFLGHFKILLEGIVANPEQRISDLPILSEAEKHQLLVEWNETKRDYPKDKCVHQLFEEQVKRTPEAVAVVFEEQQLTYRELNRRANRIARRLRRVGVGPDVLVGLCVERSVELVIGILAILKAGGAYVPFDPSYPKDRLEFMLKDSDVSVLLTQKQVAANLPAQESAIVYLDVEHLDFSSAEPLGDANLESQIKSDSLAYVIYTSGSTGKPKGVLITHYNVVRLFQSTRPWFDFQPSDVWTLFHSYAFDFSVWEIWGALFHGGRLVVVSHAVSRSPKEFAALVKQNGVTVLNQTPSAFRQLIPYLISTLPPERSALRRVIFGGEALDLQSLQPWFDCYGDESPQLINMYGITETTVHVTYRPISQADIKSKAGSVVGRPIPDLKVYVLDARQHLQPLGIPGEIYIGGAGVANGYLHRPELTADRFTSDPFSSDPQARLYRSGDLARWLPNGELEYLGRIDDQVKIRGYRIELGEIEAVLGQHPAVRGAVVLAREDNPGDKRLVTYVVAAPGSTPSANELRSFLQQKLPEYMVPSVFMFLEALPLTPNGKVDRKALPASDQLRAELAGVFAPPQTPVQEMLAGIWAEVLKLDKVGIHNNFFELGGHSLLATRVVSKIREVFRIELPLRALFEKPTVASLSDHVEVIRWEGEENQAEILKHLKTAAGATPMGSSLPRVSREKDLPLSFAQQRLWFLDQLEPGSTVYNVPGALRIEGPLSVEVLERCFNEIVRRHEALRTTFSIVEEEPVQVIAASANVSLSVIDISYFCETEREEEALRLAAEEANKPFDLRQGPLFRTALIRLGENEHILLLTLHHIVSDGWSMGVLYRELSALYQAFANEEPAPLADLPIQYADFAAWQREWLQGEVLETQLSYWKKQLDGAPAVLNLPTDRPRPAEQSYRGARQSIELSSELTQGLKALSRKEGVTLYMALLAAFQILLHRHTGQDDIVVGSPIANRNRIEIEGLIGFFVNTLVLRTDHSGNPTFCELLHRVRETALEAYAHQDLPFEKLVEELRPDRDLGRSSLFQAMFVFQNAPAGELNCKGLNVSPMRIAGETTKFDLTLSVHEGGPGLRAGLQYSTDLFEETTITRFLGHFKILLEGIVANPEQRISDLPILSEAEKHQLLVEWNETKRDYPKDKCVHQLFEEQVKRTPEAVAVVFEEQQLTYRELNTRANQLAHYLKKLGVGPEVLVGICVERSLEMIVGLLGVLKAGGAYVPLDPGYPQERLAFMLEDAGVGVLLTQQGVDAKLSQHPARVIYLDGECGEIAQQSEENLNSEITGENLAYVIYTSGSTGKPKGVGVEHRQVLNYVFSILDRMALAVPRSFATVSTLGADLGNTVIFSSLCTGAALHIMSRDRIADAQAMADYFSRQAIDCLKIVPSHLAALQASSRPESVLPRKLLILGGEASSVEWVKSLQRLAPECTILNHYGPTESTIGVATYRMERDTQLSDLSTVPLGRPLSNSQIYLLDQNLNPVRVGVAGELHIGGLNLARGYLHGPELTAEKFIANPFSDEPGARLYKTGDRARYLADGNIEFLGRVDHQVKIRGYRIEPGEIEAALREHPDIRESVVEVREDKAGDKRLIAYVVARPDRAPTVGGKPRYRLPNGAAVAQLNKNETDYIYQEIFERQAYLRHGITIKDGDCIFDVGANIGLFTVFANQIAKQPRVYSFEPNPAVYEILSANAALYGSDVRVFNCGLSNEAKRTPFTFFPGFSFLSGFYADAQADKEVVKTFMLNQHRAGLAEMAELVEQADAILAKRFEPQSFDAELRTMSSIIEQEDLERIDLLKINVEKSELDVLSGIKDHDWQKIKQIVLEVDVKENLPIITDLLERHGYQYAVEQDNLLEGTSLCYVYAIRASNDRVLVREQPNGTYIQPIPGLNTALLSTADLRNYLGDKLPEHMVPSAVVFLDALPLTLNGKVDRRALPAPDPIRPESDQTFAAPRTPVEEVLANIWAEVLKVDKVGIHDNFFEFGGHSLLATRVVSKIREVFRIELPLRALFEKPTVASLSDHVEVIRWEGEENQAEILKHLKTAAGATPMGSSLPRVSREKDLPLSFAQQRLWFLDQLEPGSTVYNVPGALRIEGPLSVEVLERCFNEIVRRHEALRTTFSIVEEEPVQVIAASANVSLSVIDISYFCETEREEEALRLAAEEANKPFDLRQGPLFRTALIRLGENEHILLLTLHHIVSDGWSMGVLYRELSALYQAFANEEPAPLADLPIQYADFAAWQREWLQGEVLETQLSYWKKQLDGAPAVLNLPTDRPRPAEQSYRGARQSIELSSELTQGLKALSRKEGVTLYMALLAAFQILLHRHTGQDDIVVGSPIANRNRIEIEGLIGFFVNTLVLRTDHSGNPTFCELLHRVRETALEAYAHQDLPFEKLVEELRPDRDLGRSSLFQAMFVFQNAPAGELNCKGLNVSPMRIAGETTKFDLTLSVHEGGPGLRAGLQYSTDLFEETTITRFLGHFKILLEGIVANPEQRISDLPILSEAEKHQLLVEWNETKRDYPKDKCVHQLFEEQVKRTPEAVAVVFEEQQLTYRELNTRANQLAHYLKKLGVGPEVLVGICVERSLEMIVGLLGVLKAGGAYVPLDPGYPQERLAFMLEDAGVGVLLTQQGVDAKLSQHPARVIYLDGECGEIAQQSEENLNSEITGENLAYVIYTSGSTGIPKGVMIPHRGLVNYLSWATLAYEVAAGQGAPVHSSIGFDLTVTSLFTPLLAGRRVELLSEDCDVEALSSLLRRESDYSLIKITPAHLELLGQELPADKLAHCQRLVIGGEALTFEKLGLWSAHAPETRLINEYGPTETVVGCCVYEVAPGNLRSGPVPIGRPIANTQIYILDQYLDPVPIGVIGELHIGGDGLARGYINRPEATKEKFIADPFSRDPDSRLYKTGDLGRYLPDGNIEFLGRIDNQVKVRGYRIELGETEAVLGQHPMVQSAVVVVREDTPGDKRLVGYVVGRQGGSLAVAEIRNYLKQKLPEYMIPSRMVVLDQLPLTPNGKVDRNALPAPAQDRTELGNIYQAPRTPIEEALASIWSKLLKVDKVGIHDNFFELGGHSLLATQAVSRMRDALGKNIPLRIFFEAPTVSELALLIEKFNGVHDDAQAPVIAPAARDSYRVKLER